MDTESLSLRPIRTEDEPFLSKLYAGTRQEEMAQSGWPQQQIDAFLQMQFQAQHKYYQEQFHEAAFDLILLGEEPVGRLYVERRSDEIRIIDIALLHEHRSRGIGSYYLKNIINEAKTANLPVRIHVEVNNPAMNLYKRLGFKKTGETGVYYLMEWSGK